MSEQHSERNRMSVSESTLDAQGIARSMFHPDINWKRAVNALFNVLRKENWTWNRCKDVWFADRRICVSGDELKHLRRAARLQREELEAGDEFRALRERLEKIERFLSEGSDMARP